MKPFQMPDNSWPHLLVQSGMIGKIVSYMGGEYHTINLRATCKTFSAAISPPQKIWPDALLVKFAAMGDMAGCIMARAKGAVDWYGMMQAGQRNGKRTICTQAYLWASFSYDYGNMHSIVRKACKMGLTKVVLDWLKRRRLDDDMDNDDGYTVIVLLRKAIKYNRVELIKPLVGSGACITRADWQLAAALGNYETATVIAQIIRHSDQAEVDY